MDDENKRPIPDSLEGRLQRIEERLRRLELSDSDAGFLLDFEEESLPAYGNYELYGIYEVDEARRDNFTLLKVHDSAGRPVAMSRPIFGKRRDRMIRWVESLWPELETVVANSQLNPVELQAALELRFPARGGDAIFQTLLKNITALWEFIHEHPAPLARHLACAMAGVGNLTWKTSLGRCDPKKEPSDLAVHFRAMNNHIQHRHRKWYRALKKEGLTARTQRAIPKDCSDCVRSINRPDRIMNAINIEPLPISEWPSNLIQLD